MTQLEILREDLKNIFRHWGDDFTIDLEQDGTSKREIGGRQKPAFFFVSITHKCLGDTTALNARVDWLGNCDIDTTGEDTWHPMTGALIFELMWFEEARPRNNSHEKMAQDLSGVEYSSAIDEDKERLAKQVMIDQGAL